MTFYWECFVDSAAPCAPKMKVQRLDLNERRRGFSYQYADYYRLSSGAADTRDLNTVFGVRLLTNSLGKGKECRSQRSCCRSRRASRCCGSRARRRTF